MFFSAFFTLGLSVRNTTISSFSSESKWLSVITADSIVNGICATAVAWDFSSPPELP